MTLSEGKIGQTYVVEEVSVAGNVTRRLEALGVNEQTGITVQNSKKRGSMIIKVRGTRLALGRQITDQIRIREA
jgi:ferrous iron transport protein A